MRIYSNSYKGYGVESMTAKILRHDTNAYIRNDVIEVYHSQCLLPGITKDWKFNGQTYLVRGSSRSPNNEDRTDRFERCKNIIDGYVSEIKDKPPGFQGHEAYAIAGYYWKALEGKIIANEGGDATVQDFKKAEQEACENADKELPFLCLQTTYVWSLLERGFGLSPSDKLHIHKTLKGNKLNWALGTAFKTIS